MIIVKPIEIQRAIKDAQKTKQEKEKEQLESEAQQNLSKAERAAQDAQDAMIRKLQDAVSKATCDSSKSICVRWQNPSAGDINMRGQGVAFRSNPDNYAEVKTSGTNSNTFISITHNDNTATTVIGDSSAILNTVTIKQNVGIAKVK
mgnify:CR=1 FL=1